MKRTTNGFARVSVAAFSQLLSDIVNKMLGNSSFTNLQTEVQALSTAAQTYYQLVSNAANRDKVAIIARDVAKQNLIEQLHSLGNDVSYYAKGNLEVLASSGFPITQDKKRTPAIQKPATPLVMLGQNAGELVCRTSKQKGMICVNYYITADETAMRTKDSSVWSVVTYNKVKYTFTNLIAGQRYYIKVGIVGVRGQEVISDATSFIPQ